MAIENNFEAHKADFGSAMENTEQTIMKLEAKEGRSPEEDAYLEKLKQHKKNLASDI